jgi:tetratricopeptide (TPR) repeat protein
MAETAVANTPPNHPNRLHLLVILGVSLGRRIDRTGSAEDHNRTIEVAVEVAEEFLKITPPGHPDRAGRLMDLGTWLSKRFERTQAIEDLNRAIEAISMAVDAVEATANDHTQLPGWLSNLGTQLSERFERMGMVEDIARAVEVVELALAIAPPDHPDRVKWLNNLGDLFGMQFQQTREIDLNRAIEVAEMAIAATPLDHPGRAISLDKLGIWLGRRSEHTGAMDDINRAIEAADMALKAAPLNYPGRFHYLNNLGIQLSRRYKQTGAIDDLNRTLEVAEMAVTATPSDHPQWDGMLNNLGNWLSLRFERTGAIDDLNRAIEVVGVAAATTSSAVLLYTLGTLLESRSEWSGSIDDLNRAIDALDMAVATTPAEHPDRITMLDGLGVSLSKRFDRTGSIDDLNRAVEVGDMAAVATSLDSPDRAYYLNNLGLSLNRRFGHTGAISDLDRAIEVADMAVAATPPYHIARAGHLNSLGCLLGRRFQWTGAIDDLNRAVTVANMAVNGIPSDHTDRGGCLHSLGNWLGMRFERTESMDDLNRAIEVIDLAVAIASPSHSDRASWLNSLGVQLGRRFQRTGAIDDLNRAIEAADMAVAAIPSDHTDRAGLLNNLGIWLGRRFKLDGTINDLNRAIELGDMAMAVAPPDHPDRASQLKNLGDWLGTRFEWTGDRKDIERSLCSFKEGWSCQNAQPSSRIELARSAAKLLALESNWEESSFYLQEAVKLLPKISPRSLDNTDKQHMLGQFAGLASMAAATSLNAGKEAHHALEPLELGRGIIAGLLFEMRTDISDLEQQHPKLAEEFEFLRDKLDSPTSNTGLLKSADNMLPPESQINRRREAGQKFDEVLAKIRAQPGFHNFLLAPTADELMAAADSGSIVTINVSPYRCDAFIIERHQIRVLELPDLSVKEIEEKVQYLRSNGITSKILEWLWDVAASPILEALGLHQPPSDDNWPHVWWILAGALSHLPLHAAGRHAKGYTETVLDRVMSSYSSSIKALIYGRRHSNRKSTGPASDHALLVAMRETPGLSADSNLPFAAKEVAMLSHLCPSPQLKSVQPQRRKKDVLAHLRTCKIFHFAGHGESNPLEPSRSCLLLEDWKDDPLTVGDFRDHWLQENSPFLGYLSACSTSANKAEKLVDEGIHLVSGCQLAGFRHVIGTLWEVSDKHCVDVAKILYETLRDEGMTDIALYRGLHRAVRALRDRRIDWTPWRWVGGNEDDITRQERDAKLFYEGNNTRQEGPQYWAPYIHFGV